MVPRASTVTRLVSPDIYHLKLWSPGRLYLSGWFPHIHNSHKIVYLKPKNNKSWKYLIVNNMFKFFKGSYFFLVEAENEGSSDQNQTIITSEK